MIKKVNPSEKLGLFHDHWSPKVVGALNGQLVKLAKLKGEFVMHQHAEEDELFYVLDGELFIELEEETLHLKQGEMVIIPKGVMHKPFAPAEVSVMLFEPNSTLNTGDQHDERTVNQLDWI